LNRGLISGLNPRVDQRRRKPAPSALAVTCEQIRVLIVDDDALVRSALSMLLTGSEDTAIVGAARTAARS